MPSSSSAPATSVQVAVRIRPTTTQDATSIPARFQRTIIHPMSPTMVSVDATSYAPTSISGAPAAGTPTTVSTVAAKKQSFTFDQVHPPAATQHALFTSTAMPLISRFIEGFNCTILAYGQTSSGKTFTMTGIDLEADPSDPNNGMGIVPRAVSTIFARTRQLKEERGGAWSCTIKGSFIEIYNEDLIDLLSMDDALGGRREVLIREDKDGNIIWGGLREVHVKSTGEVMNLIRKGTSIRRTNETEMNAQSSRSHAIFSLTLTQKKFSGSGPPPRSSSPMSSGRSPSRLARPGSMFAGGATSPTQNRPATPSFASAMGRGGLRPASAMGMRSQEARDSLDEEAGEWVTVVSKFHFVDLAGSERLKRTAAVGERIKEGISINSGLLALGNVISALGDPSRAKSHTNSHVPYRDSKLTRLLQDSLGGNAHTLMIACVSPAEWNVGETVNTLKYANRARNIKNRAVVNEKEDGWDDMEWLQGTVTRLRKELKLIKEGVGVGGSTLAPRPVSDVVDNSSKKMLAQMTELQNNYEDLRGKFVERTEELTRLRRELGHKHRSSSGGAVGGTSKYEEIVGPVIEEYEKTIAAMEAELSLNRAALRMTNEMVEEKEDEFATLTERHTATELYVEDLRNRVAKLAEREASTEAYVRDLEEKIKIYDESSLTSSESMTDLKREVARFRDSENNSGQYIVELEARLGRSDESVITLQQTVEKLETMCERRQEEIAILQNRLESLTRDGESWRSDLEERERKVVELEAKMADWERKRKEAGEERARLGVVVGEVALARKSLEVVNGLTPAGSELPSRAGTPLNKADLELEAQLSALQQTHTATLADLSNVTSKYRDALQEITDLAAQIQELKLNNPAPTVPPSPASDWVEIPSTRRRIPTRSSSNRDLVEPQYDAAGRRLFFKQAASAEGLHARSLSQSQSQPLSQELSSARLRKSSFSSHDTGSSLSRSPSRNQARSHHHNLSIVLPPTPTTPSPNTGERSVHSLEKEIMRLQEVLREREAEISSLEESMNDMVMEQNNRSAPSQEIPKVNGVHVEDATFSPTTTQQIADIRKAVEKHHFASESVSGSEADDSLDRFNELMLSMAQKESQHREVVEELESQLVQVRRQLDDLRVLSRDQAHNMSTELETLRLKYNEDLTNLEQIQQRESELLESLQKAEADHAAEFEELRTQHEETLRTKSAELDDLLAMVKSEHESVVADLHTQLSDASAALTNLRQEHEEAFGKLKVDHEAELNRKLQEANAVLESTKRDHQATTTKIHAAHEETLKQKDAEANAVLQRTEEDYYNALTKLRGDHAKALEAQAAEASLSLERLREEHTAELRMVEIARQGSLSESESARNAAIHELRDEHATAISRKEAAFVDQMEKLKVEHGRVITTKEEDRALALDKLKSEYEGILARLREESRVEIERFSSLLRDQEENSKAAAATSTAEKEAALRALQDEHNQVIRETQRTHLDLAKKLKDAHTAASKEAATLAEQEKTSLLQSHVEEMDAFREAHELAIQETLGKSERERSAIEAAHSEEIAKLKSAHESALKDAATAAEKELAPIAQSHNEALEKLESTHQTDLQHAHTKAEELRSLMLQAHTEEIASLKHQHQVSITETNATLTAVQLKHQEDLETARTNLEERLAQERTIFEGTFADLRKRYSQERDALRKEHELLGEELETYKNGFKELVVTQEESRGMHEMQLAEKATVIQEMEKTFSTLEADRTKLTAELTQLKDELSKAQSEQSTLREECSRRETAANELEKQRLELAETKEMLRRVKEEKDTLQTEKSKRDSLIRELQNQLAQVSSDIASRSHSDRYSRSSKLALKLLPPSPPPVEPPPQAPSLMNGSVSSIVSSSATSPTSRESQLESPATSLGHTTVNGNQSPDPKLVTQLEEQTKQIEEQTAMIKTLNKQLTHCEHDLQTYIDLSATLEGSLGDSEKNLRKARMHATELARERDNLNAQIEHLRHELSRAQSEVATVRKSIAEEKLSLETRLDEERRAKERARAQLDSRMDDITRRKSKFACL